MKSADISGTQVNRLPSHPESSTLCGYEQQLELAAADSCSPA
jgi:hypothetical protein